MGKKIVGMAVGRDLLGKKNNVISVIGDGAMTAGQAYEAMNNAGFLDSNLIVVLNDNKQVSLPTATLDGPATPVGALSSTLSKLQASTKFRKLREAAKVKTLIFIFRFGLLYVAKESRDIWRNVCVCQVYNALLEVKTAQTIGIAFSSCIINTFPCISYKTHGSLDSIWASHAVGRSTIWIY